MKKHKTTLKCFVCGQQDMEYWYDVGRKGRFVCASQEEKKLKQLVEVLTTAIIETRRAL